MERRIVCGADGRLLRMAVGLICVVVAACGSPSQTDEGTSSTGSSWSSLYEDGAVDVGSYVMGFREEDITAGTSVGTNTYSVPARQPVSVTYHALSSLPDQTHLRITLLIDLEQARFTVDGQDGVLHDIVLENQVIRDIPVVLPPLEEGAHDLIWLAFLSPDEHSDEEDFRFQQTYARSDRITLLAAGSETWNAIEVEQAPLYEPPEGGSLPAFAFATRSDDSLLAWLAEEVSPGERLDYWIVSGYHPSYSLKGSGENTFAVLAFLDYLLVPLDADDGELVHYYSLDESNPGMRAEATLIAPESEGPHEFCVIRINSPNHSFDELIRAGAIRATRPLVDRRTLITVR